MIDLILVEIEIHSAVLFHIAQSTSNIRRGELYQPLEQGSGYL